MKSRDARAVADFLVNLRPEERALMFALLENAADVDAACAYADWLEENGRHEAGARIRRLAPQSGDVLVFTVPGDDGDGRVTAAADVTGARLRAHGRRVTCLVLAEGCTLAQVGEDGMRAAGWVRQERLIGALLAGAAAERAACAVIAEDADGYAERDGEIWYPGERIAEAIRARGGYDHFDEVRKNLERWPASAGFASGGVAWDTPATPAPVTGDLTASGGMKR